MSEQSYFNKAWPLCLDASKVSGVRPEIIFAQSALETGYGLHAPQNNFFGIKGAGGSEVTTEYIAGVATRLQQHFLGYATMAASFQGYASFIRRNRRYATFRSGGSISAELVALGTSGYATDPNYALKVGVIVDKVPHYLEVYSESYVMRNLIDSYPLKISATAKATVTVDKPSPQPENIVMSDLSKFLENHKNLLGVAANVINGLLAVAPIPAIERAAIGDVVSGIAAVVAQPTPAITIAAGPAMGGAGGPLPPNAGPIAVALAAMGGAAVTGDTGIVGPGNGTVGVVTLPAVPGLTNVIQPAPPPSAPSPVQQSFKDAVIGDAIAQAETLIPELFQQYTSGGFTVGALEVDALQGAENVVQELEDEFNPGLGIKKNPNAN